jgi:hypothetical protein
MLTIFACPKPFTNPHIAIIQRNAITSWTLLRPRPEIILFGNEKGTAEICQELGLRHTPELARNEFGTPLLNDIFELMCYVNADIILMSDFVVSLRLVRQSRDCFLMVGRRWDIQIDGAVRYGDGWEDWLWAEVKKRGVLHPAWGIDYFTFPKGLWSDGAIPPFAVGRLAWDQWIVYYVRRSGMPVIDATALVHAVHQDHDYSHHALGETGIRGGVEALHNRRLAGYVTRFFSVRAATHRLTGRCIERDFVGVAYVPILKAILGEWLQAAVWFPLRVSRPLRYRLGLTRGKPLGR